jgi:hypothetical protein
MRKQAIGGSLKVRIVSKKPVVGRDRFAATARGFVNPGQKK